MFSHRFHGSAQMVRLCRFSHGIHGSHRITCSEESPTESTESTELLAEKNLPRNSRNPQKLGCAPTIGTGFRPPSDRIPSAVQSDSVRRPINFLQIYLVQSQYIHHNLQTLTKHIHSINTHILAFNPLKSPILVDLSQIEPKNEVFLKLFCQNTCKVMIFVIPLHPLSRTN